MTDDGLNVDLYYSYRSPYSYLAVGRMSAGLRTKACAYQYARCCRSPSAVPTSSKK